MSKLYIAIITVFLLKGAGFLVNFNTGLSVFPNADRFYGVENKNHEHCHSHLVHETGEISVITGNEFEKIKCALEERLETDGYKIQKLVIDAGHGGKDHGCSGKNSIEKEITLKIALKLGKFIRENYPDLKIIYTRTEDVFVPLHERANLANQNQADLFISIHCNAIRNASRMKGLEVFVMGLHTAEENLEVAKRENSAILLEENYEQNYGGYDPNSPEGHIILSMYQNAFLEQSILFAGKVDDQVKYVAKRNSNGIKQAGFVVLRATAMPSVLIEAGYLTNESDERFLRNAAGQELIADAIMKAFQDYKYEVESKSQEYTLPQASQVKSVDSRLPVYKIQVAASSEKINTATGLWQKLADFEVEQADGFYKYLVGAYPDIEAASAAQKQIRNYGFEGSFVVAYLDGERISVQKATKLVPNSGTQ